MMKFSTYFILLLVLTIQLSAQSNLLERPGEIGIPTDVKVLMYVFDIVELDSKNQKFMVDFILKIHWKDERISKDIHSIPLKNIWNPNIQIYNVRSAEKYFEDVVKVLDDGLLQYRQRYHAEINNRFNFREFPFDQQKLIIRLLSFGNSDKEVNIVFEDFGSEESFSVLDWELKASGHKIGQFSANFGNNEKVVRPIIDFEFLGTRYVSYYWWKIVAPLILIIAFSWAVFWIDPAQVGAQVGIIGTSILTLIAFLLRIESFLPPVSYLTRIDHFILASLFLVFVSFLEAMTSTTISLNGNSALALKIDFVFRIIYPIIFLIIVLYFWVFV